MRNHNLGRRVRYLEYEAYEPLALKTFERIAAEVERRWPGVRLALHHRIGRLEIGEASVAIAAASPHRADAYAACRYAIERVKQIAPIWKREFFDGGDVWIEGATADPADEHGPRRGGADGMRVTVRLFARLRDIAGRRGAGARGRPGRDDRQRLAAARQRVSGARALRAVDLERGQRRLRANGHASFETATRSRFCRRCRGGDDDQRRAR